ALYESGLELYVASAADDGDAWQATLVHLARESRAFVIAPCHYQRGSSYPADFELTEELAGGDLLGRGGSAILAPDGSYLAGPLYDEEGILYADLDPAQLAAERQRFDPAGHYHRPELLRLTLTSEQVAEHVRRVPVGREDRIEDLLDHAVARDERDAFVELPAVTELEGRQAELVPQAQFRVADELERQVQS